MDDGAEKIANPEELALVRRLGVRMIASSLATAIFATTLFVVAPV